MVILIVGSTGAGKTTYAKMLANQIKAAVFSIDDWMKALYWQDMPAHPDNQWFLDNSKWYTDRISRCEDLILKGSLDRAGRNENTILDLGFSTAEHRRKFIDIFLNHRVHVETHFLDVPIDVRWSRVQQRNANKGDTFVMAVDRSMFDYIESIFESPQAAEGADLKVIHAENAGFSTK